MPDTIIVALRRPWWNQKELRLYKRAPEGVEMPAEHENILPSTAVILTEIEVRKEKRRAKKAKVKAKEEEPDTLGALAKTLPPDFPRA